jgi:cell division protein ZipA
MQYLRWILLGAGVIFVLIVYFISRQQRRRNTYTNDVELQSDLPEISARDWDDIDEGVGKVRVVATQDDIDIQDAEPALEIDSNPDIDIHSVDQPASKTTKTTDKSPRLDDLVTLYLLAKDDALSGDVINSAAYANGLVFGKMNIFHRLDEHDEPLYSLANMMEPGYFDADSIHNLKTKGLVLFIQLAQLKHSSEALHDMLRCGYRMAEMIGARLCNSKRKPLTETDTNAYRELAARFDDES